MPTYDYRCTVCGHIFELNVRIADRDAIQPICPACHPVCPRVGTPLSRAERLPAAPSVCYTLHDRKKVPEGFKDVLRNIKKNNVGSLIEV